MLIAAWLCLAGCRGERPCEADADCERYERAVCQLGQCVCEFDELERCLCDTQSRCDEVYGVGERLCVAGACHACVADADCGRLERCGADGECFPIECLGDNDCTGGFCEPGLGDCVACRVDADCPGAMVCRDDGACVDCTTEAQCGAGEVCDVDIQPAPMVEIVGTNQCGLDCSPRCRADCDGDPECLMRPACVVADPLCLGDRCPTWDDCELPSDCELLLGPCPAGVQCEALAASWVVPIHYACLPTPCLYDFECEAPELCYEGRCLRGCDDAADCAPGETCVPRVYFERGACIAG